MKKSCIIFLLSCILSVTAFSSAGCAQTSTATDRYLRIHIRADSNESTAQAAKYAVRDAVVDYLTPIAASAQDFGQAALLLEQELDALEEVANAVLRGQGFDYRAHAALQVEKFPTRKYGQFVLEEGEYLALILRLGRGKGENWWCVIYPPLCFAGQQNIVYKSKILELIEKWKG